jgi:molecular chaperone HscB
VVVANHSMSNLPPLNREDDFFTYLGLGTPRFDLDLEQLTQAYHSLQRTYHPDRYRQSSDEIRQHSLMHSMHIAEAYKALKNPLSRAEYLLLLQQHNAQKAQPSHALLETIFAQREALEQAKDRASLEKMAQDIANKKQEAIHHFQSSFEQHVWEEAIQAILFWRYLEKAEAEAKEKLKS